MHRKHSRIVAATSAAVALVVATLIAALPAPSWADAASASQPQPQPPSGVETLVTNDGTVVAVPLPGLDRHGWTGALGTADDPAPPPTTTPPGSTGPADPPAPGEQPGSTGAVEAPVPAGPPVDETTADTMSIIGPDDMVRVADVGAYPARATGLITRQGFPHCTGTLVSPDTVLTAGHCVHDTTGGQAWWSGLAFHTRLFTDNHQACAARADGLMAFRGWVEQGDERYDIGLVKLTCDLGQTVGWLGIGPEARTLTGTEVTIQGYPGERLAQLWMSVGPVIEDDRQLVFYDNDTLSGMSGAGLQRHQPHRGRSCAGHCILAVHAYGLHDEGLHSQHNHGARLTPGKTAALRAGVWPA